MKLECKVCKVRVEIEESYYREIASGTIQCPRCGSAIPHPALALPLPPRTNARSTPSKSLPGLGSPKIVGIVAACILVTVLCASLLVGLSSRRLSSQGASPSVSNLVSQLRLAYPAITMPEQLSSRLTGFPHSKVHAVLLARWPAARDEYETSAHFSQRVQMARPEWLAVSTGLWLHVQSPLHAKYDADMGTLRFAPDFPEHDDPKENFGPLKVTYTFTPDNEASIPPYLVVPCSPERAKAIRNRVSAAWIYRFATPQVPTSDYPFTTRSKLDGMTMAHSAPIVVTAVWVYDPADGAVLCKTSF